MSNSINVRPRNWLFPVALVALSEERSYGDQLMERLAEFGFEQIRAGMLYRVLRKMEQEGLCKSERKISNGGGPACRVYAVTNEGQAYLEDWIEGCKKYQQVIDAFSLAYARGGNPPPHASECSEPS